MLRALVAIVLVGLAGLIAVSCSEIGDDRFPKLPDASLPDALDLTPDAGGAPDAVIAPDAAVDAAPDADRAGNPA